MKIVKRIIKNKWFKRITAALVCLTIFGTIAFFGIQMAVDGAAKKYIVKFEDIPEADAVIVLGALPF